ncbi:MAG TPA: hypothetical protein VM099_06875 [Gemmatimonadaceae bacterium]|nr:hypothetical protein [Gemmatimonadaceae bacterium]
MNRTIVGIVATSILLGASGLTAQGIDPQCPPGSQNSAGQPDNTMVAQDACQKAIDLFNYMAPQLGAIVAGGSATQGYAGTLGGIFHFSAGIRGNGLKGSLPDVDRVTPSTKGAQQSTYSITDAFIGLPVGDVSVGILGGLPLGLTKLGGIDFLLSAAYLPAYNNSSLDIAVPSGSWKVGYGVKVGIIQEGPLFPGVSFSYLTRGLPTLMVTGISGEDRLFLDSLRVTTHSWRLVAGKTFVFLGGSIGYGKDTYDSDADIRVAVAPRPLTQGGTGGPVALTQKLTRSNVFGSLWIDAHVFKLVGELGSVSGGEVLTYNHFDGPDAAASRRYGSIGISIGF